MVSGTEYAPAVEEHLTILKPSTHCAMAPQRDDGFGRTSEEEKPLVGEIRSRRFRRGGGEDPDRASVMAMIREIPNFLKLLWRLTTDSRVSNVDKGILAGTIAYMVMPMDLIPDFIIGLGQVDDLYLLALTLNRLLNNAGMEVLMEHWDGEPEHLEQAIGMLDKAGALLPERVRRLLGVRAE
ncbi:hypothetical protein BH24GEM2_BH24GEM2_10050 [soil metagenome]